jgi:hypothetical protein
MKKEFILGITCLLLTLSVFSQSKKEWEKVQSLNSWNVYEQFIHNYPNGKYTEEAKQKQSLLKPPAPVNPAPVNTVEEKKVAGEDPVEKRIVAAQADSSMNKSQILVKKGRYYVDDKPIKGKELKTLLKSDPESAVYYKKSKTFATVGYVLEVPAVLLIYSVAGVIPGILGGVLVATPFLIVSNKHMKKSIEIYNSKHSSNTTPELK